MNNKNNFVKIKEKKDKMEVEKVLKLLVEKGHLSEDILPQILSDEDFKKKRKERKKKTSEERRGVYDENKCQARVWLDGYDNIQCSFSKHEGGCMCKKHQGCVDREGVWWLGKITETRPEKLFWRGIEHYWKIDKDGNEIERKKETNEHQGTSENKQDEGEAGEPVKRKRGRPKGSKNKKKKESKELSIEEITDLLDQKKKEKEETELEKEEKETDGQEKDEQEIDDPDGVSLYKVDGVPYEINGNDIMDPEDFSPIGSPDGHGGIIFEDEDAKERHKENIEKYSN